MQFIAHSATVLTIYGVFLITCGIVAVSFIGLKAKTALVSGGMSGTSAIICGYLIGHGYSWAYLLGLMITLGLLGVFSWRCTKTLFSIFDMIPEKHPDLKGKGIAFLIIGCMALVSLFSLMLQFVFYKPAFNGFL
ncbi:MAG: hypothetical protein ACT6QS_14075 [Flavobacteriales bacterium]